MLADDILGEYDDRQVEEFKVSERLSNRALHAKHVINESGRAFVVFCGLAFHDESALLDRAGFWRPVRNENEPKQIPPQQYVSRLDFLGQGHREEGSLVFELYSDAVLDAVFWARDELKALDERRYHSSVAIGAITPL